MQQFACPNCRMTVSVLAADRIRCPGCRAAMRPVEESAEEPIVAEPEDMLPMSVVELGSDAPPMRPTVVVPHGAPPKWKATPVAQAWTAVARGLRFQFWGVFFGLVLLLADLSILFLAWGESDQFAIAEMTLAAGMIGSLFVIGRLYCYRVPPKTGARLWMAIACAGTAVATVFTSLTGVANVLPSKEGFETVLLAGQWISLGLWLVSEGAFLWALGRIGYFVKRPRLALFSYTTAGVAALLPVVWLAWGIVHRRGPHWPRLETALYAMCLLCVLYLFLLSMARSAVQMKTSGE